jgi:hypothetical protein
LLELIDSQDVWCLINSLSLSFAGFLSAENVMSDQNFRRGEAASGNPEDFFTIYNLLEAQQQRNNSNPSPPPSTPLPPSVRRRLRRSPTCARSHSRLRPAHTAGAGSPCAQLVSAARAPRAAA